MKSAGVRVIWLLALLAAGCATDNSPEGECGRQSYDDPVVKGLMTQAAASPALQAANQEPLKRARKSAINRCLVGKGVLAPGGVEAPIPPS